MATGAIKAAMVAALLPLGRLAWLAPRPEVTGEAAGEEKEEGGQRGCVSAVDPFWLAS